MQTHTHDTTSGFIPNTLLLKLEVLRLSVNHPDPRAHLLKLDSAERLGQNISQLIIGTDLLHLNLPLLCTLSHQVILHFNMFASTAQDWILDQCHCQLIIHHQSWHKRLCSQQFSQDSAKPNCLTSPICCRNIFSFRD
jgi:hypothetical protein